MLYSLERKNWVCLRQQITYDNIYAYINIILYKCIILDMAPMI